MGLLDDVTKLASVSGGGAQGNSALINGVLQMLGASGAGSGLASIVQGFQKSGLGDAAASWVSTGQNLPISADQLQQGLGAGRVKQLAQASGLPEGAAASALAALLPTVIDRLTPNGAIPEAGQLPQLIGLAKTALGA